MKDQQIKAYRAVMMFGTMTLAAEMIASTQPGISRMVSQLEHEIGFKLFEKVKGKLHPTPEGRLFYQEVDRSFVGIDRLSETARNIRDMRTGELIIASMPALSLTFLPAVIARFLNKNPEVNISLNSFLSNQVRNWAATQQCDLGLAITREENPAYVAKELATASVCILPPGHPLKDKDVIVPADLADEVFISFDKDLTSRFYIDQLFFQHRVKRRLQIETSFCTTICCMVNQGLGVSIVDPLTAQGFASSGLIIKPLEPVVPFEFSLLFSADRLQSRLAKVFVEELLDTIDDMGIQLIKNMPPI